MPLKTTFEAHFKSTFTLHFLLFALLNKVVTIRSRTPLEIRIQVNINVFLESEILVEYFLRSEFPNLVASVLFWARLPSTLNLLHLAIRDIVL